MSARILPELICLNCGHTGADYEIRERGVHSACFCAGCGQYIKNLSKEDKYGTKEQQDEIWKKTRGRCLYCGYNLNPFKKRGFTYEHMEPQSNGGGHETENLYLCCVHCNSQKGKKTVEEYRAYIIAETRLPKHVFYFEVLQFSKLGEILSVMF